ncbi:MAG: winged helix-turn-helix transcriptional regulator [Candidatus Bathyarchaeia archaeon]
MTKEGLTSRTFHILKTIFELGNRATIHIVEKGQDEIANKLGITRQALNVHLKKLREMNYVKTGRGFVNITEKGVKALGFYENPALILIRVLPQKRSEAYKEIKSLPATQILRVTGDVDVAIITDQSKMDEILKSLSRIEGIEETRTYVSIETLS